MEAFLGRKLNEGWVVHHDDEDSTNDKIDNLVVFVNQSDHKKYHANQCIRDSRGKFL